MSAGSKNARQFGALFGEVIPFRATIDPAAFVDDESQVVDVAVPGAAVGDFVLVTPGVDAQESIITAYVRAAGIVEVVIAHVGGDTTNLASSTWSGVVLKAGDAFQGL